MNFDVNSFDPADTLAGNKEIVQSKLVSVYTPSFHGQSQVSNIVMPFEGSSLNTVLGSVAANIQERRLKEFVNSVSGRIELMQDDVIDKEYINSEEFIFFMHNIVSSVLNEKEKEKLEFFKNIFIGGILTSRKPDYFLDYCLKTLATLTLAEIRILKYFVDKFEANERNADTTDLTEAVLPHEVVTSEDMGLEYKVLNLPLIKKLLNESLIMTTLSEEHPLRENSYMISDLGRQFVDTIIKFE